jgi:hypothetical protein
MNVPLIKNILLTALLAALPAAAAVPPESPYSTPQPPFYGQVRNRVEFEQKALTDTSSKHSELLGLLRTRLGFVAVPNPAVEVKIEFQDNRAWGSEAPATATNPTTSTVANSKGVDLTQGYVAVEEGIFKTAIGRQKMTLGAGRFLSTLEWNNQSRALDGWSGNLNLGAGNLTGLAYLVRDTSVAWSGDYTSLFGLYYSHQITPDIVAEPYLFYDKSKLPAVFSGDTLQNYDLLYFGERVAGKVSFVTFEEEFIWQGGEMTKKSTNMKSAAFQLATRLGVAFGNYKANIGVDMMSGDDKPGDSTLHTYRANYYFAHALYGWMDYFVNNPRFGVIDYRVDADLGFLPNQSGNPRVTLKPQYHFFTPAKAATVAPATDKPYGQELDLEAHLAFFPKSNIVLGAGLFLPDDGAYQIGAPAMQAGRTALTAKSKTEPGLYFYFMPTFNF